MARPRARSAASAARENARRLIAVDRSAVTSRPTPSQREPTGGGSIDRCVLVKVRTAILGTLSSLHAHDRAKKWTPTRARKSVSGNDLPNRYPTKRTCAWRIPKFLSNSRFHDVGRIVRCAIWPFFFCTCWQR